MVYVPFVSDKPVIADNGDVVINNTRQNLMALRDGLVAGALVGWDLTVTVGGGTAEEPDEIIYKNGTEWIRLDLTWGTTGGDDGQVTVCVYAYSANSGGLYDTIGTLTNTYNGNGTLTASVWS
jgi:hypothetical protein